MKAGNPVEQLAAAVYSACLRDLDPIESPEYEFKRTPGEPGTKKVPTGRKNIHRPDPYNTTTTMFPQTWGSTALGFGGIGGQAITEAYTVIVEGPLGDHCVYFGGQLAYHIRRPSLEFFEDMVKRSMVKVKDAMARYEMPTSVAGGA